MLMCRELCLPKFTLTMYFRYATRTQAPPRARAHMRMRDVGNTSSTGRTGTARFMPFHARRPRAPHPHPPQVAPTRIITSARRRRPRRRPRPHHPAAGASACAMFCSTASRFSSAFVISGNNEEHVVLVQHISTQTKRARASERHTHPLGKCPRLALAVIGERLGNPLAAAAACLVVACILASESVLP